MNLATTRSTTRLTGPARRTRLMAATTAIAAIAALAAGCSSGDGADDAASDGRATTTSSTPADLTLVDPWVKAADSGMTAAFGTLVNEGDTDVTVLAATSDVTPAMELHETVATDDGAMAMQPKTGGFVSPPGRATCSSPAATTS